MLENPIKTQLAVLGAGPGGYAAAFYAADLGMEVVLIDRHVTPGGICLYEGCIPSKALLHVAKILDEARQATRWGITFAEPTIDLEKIRAQKNSIITQLTRGLGQLAKARNVKLIQGTGHFRDAHTLHIEQKGNPDLMVQADHIIVATGSQPTLLPGITMASSRLWDSARALDLPLIPKRLLVVGGGYIGLELGSVYAALGSAVSIIEMTAGILPGVDRDLSLILEKKLKKRFNQFFFNTKLGNISEDPAGLKVSYEDAQGVHEDIYDCVLVSTGRRPDTTSLNLSSAQIACDERGFIKVNPSRQTSVSHVYAIGDIAGNPMLAHKAAHEARVAVDAIAGKEANFHPRAIPAVVFTDPEIAWCGLSEEAAKNAAIDFEIARFPWAASGRALTLGETSGLTKLLIDPQSQKILGVAMVGPGAGELIAEGVLAIEKSATVSDLKNCIHPHPTLSETLMEAAESFLGHCTHLYKPKRRENP